MKKTIGRILIGRYHLDGHDRGVMSVIAALRDAGFEVIYMLFTHPQEVIKATLNEDPDVVGLTSSLGQHNLFVSLLMEGFEKEDIDIPVILGGIIPSSDIAEVKSLGVKEVFGPGSRPESAVQLCASFVDQNNG